MNKTPETSDAIELSTEELEQAQGGAQAAPIKVEPGDFKIPPIHWFPPIINPGDLVSFKLTIPGPSFVQVANAEGQAPVPAADAPAVRSAVDVYSNLVEE